MAHFSRRLTLAAITAGVLGLTATAAFAATGWTVVAPPTTPANTNDVINAAFARTDTDVWAVGSTYVDAGAAPAAPIAIHWNGSAWSTVPTPAPDSTERFAGLLAVSASSATDAWTVGFTLPTSGVYNGATNSLYDHWNGTAWSTVAGPNIGRLVGVADFGPSNAWAVSGTGNLAQWNGTAWTAVTAPQPNPSDTDGNSITSLSADSPNDIWAVGSYTNASYANALYALHYNGTAWSVANLPSPNPDAPSPTLTSVAAVSPTDVWTVGNISTSGTPVIDQYNGTSWQQIAPPSGLFDPSLSVVSERSASDVWIFGSTYTNAAGSSYELLLSHWNGTAWTTSTSPLGLNVYSSVSSAVSSPDHYWAFGTNSNNQPLILNHS